jgi:hypothetical protein
MLFNFKLVYYYLLSKVLYSNPLNFNNFYLRNGKEKKINKESEEEKEGQ